MAPEVKDVTIKSELNNHQVKFSVGPEDSEFILDRTKLSKYVHSLDQFNSSNNHVDIDPSSFQVFADMVNGKGIAITSATIALQLLGLAEKIYSLKLHYACNEYMKSNYKGHQALIIYEYAKTDGLQELANNCLEYLKSNFGDVIQSSYFLKINVDIVADLYSRDNLTATNVQLIEALVKYAKVQKTADIRSYMKVTVDMIRFEDMKIEELLHINGIEVLLTADEVLQKMKMIPNKPKVDCNKLHIIEFALDNERTMDLNDYDDNEPLSFVFSFSETVYLESIHVKDLSYNFDIDTINVSISSIPITIRTDSNWIYLGKTVNKDENVSLEMYEESDGYSCSISQSKMSSLSKGVTVSPPNNSYQDICITDIIVKRNDLDAELTIDIKQ